MLMTTIGYSQIKTFTNDSIAKKINHIRWDTSGYTTVCCDVLARDIAGYNNGKLEFVKDSLRTINILFESFFSSVNQQKELSKKYWSLVDQYNAINNILMNVRENGTIIDIKKFDKAVYIYKKLNEIKK